MTIEKFIEEYKKTNDKTKFLSTHVINNYIDYEMKITKCQSIVDKTCEADINNKKMFLSNRPIRHYMFNIELIRSYTDIEFGTGEQLLKDYNALNKEQLVIGIISNIPRTEYLEFEMILNMLTDDYYDNCRSLTSFLDTKIEAFQLANNAIAEAFTEMLNEE